VFEESCKAYKLYLERYGNMKRWKGLSMEEHIVKMLLKPICSIYGFGVVMQTARRLFEKERKK